MATITQIALFETSKHEPDTGRCARCGRVLRSPASLERGMGPVCARKQRTEAGQLAKPPSNPEIDDRPLLSTGKKADLERKLTKQGWIVQPSLIAGECAWTIEARHGQREVRILGTPDELILEISSLRNLTPGLAAEVLAVIATTDKSSTCARGEREHNDQPTSAGSASGAIPPPM